MKEGGQTSIVSSLARARGKSLQQCVNPIKITSAPLLQLALPVSLLQGKSCCALTRQAVQLCGRAHSVLSTKSSSERSVHWSDK